jgi:hypothetical protein
LREQNRNCHLSNIMAVFCQITVLRQIKCACLLSLTSTKWYT